VDDHDGFAVAGDPPEIPAERQPDPCRPRVECARNGKVAPASCQRRAGRRARARSHTSLAVAARFIRAGRGGEWFGTQALDAAGIRSRQQSSSRYGPSTMSGPAFEWEGPFFFVHRVSRRLGPLEDVISLGAERRGGVRLHGPGLSVLVVRLRGLV